MAFNNRDFFGILIIFIGAIIAVTFMSPIGDQINLQTTTFNTINVTVTAPSAGNGTVDLFGREVVGGTGVITNATAIRNDTINDTFALGANNFTIITGTGSNGLLTVQLLLNDTGAAAWADQSVNVSYEYRPDGYINDSGGRSVTRLILIFAALAILVFVVVVLMSGSLGEIIRKKK